MKGFYTIILLALSNIFMTFAWYGHLKLQETKISSNWPLIGVILFSWAIAFFEYSLQIPANRIGFQGNGGPEIKWTLGVKQVSLGRDVSLRQEKIKAQGFASGERNSVFSATPFSGSPTAGSYSYPQSSQIYFISTSKKF